MAESTIIEEVARLVKEGKNVTFKAKGRSMLPFIKGEKDNIILVWADSVQVGDVVLAWVDDSHYVIHRIIAIDGQNLTLMGDGNLSGFEHCKIKDVAARVDYVVKTNGERIYLYTPRQKCMARLWYYLRPVRRYLLAIYRRL